MRFSCCEPSNIQRDKAKTKEDRSVGNSFAYWNLDYSMFRILRTAKNGEVAESAIETYVSYQNTSTRKNEKVTSRLE